MAKGQPVTDGLRVLAWTLGDIVRGRVGRPAARLMDWLGRLPLSRRWRLRLLMTSQRLRPSTGVTARLLATVKEGEVSWTEMMPDNVPLYGAVVRSIILRPPTVHQGALVPGVLLIKFTETLRFYAHHVDRERLLRYFRVIVEPSWTGYALPEILSFGWGDAPVLVQASDRADRAFLAQIGGGLLPVPLGSGEWVDDEVFHDRSDEETVYDAVYVANYTAIKRVPAFLRAVAAATRLKPTFKAALVCSRWGKQRQAVAAAIRWFGLSGAVDWYEALEQGEVAQVVRRARCCVLMSRKEGSNRSLFEGMFAGTAAVLIDENVGVNRDRITDEGGVVCAEADLPQVLLEIAKGDRRFRSRQWALRNIAASVSTRRVEEILRETFPEDGAVGQLLVKVNAPEVLYRDENLRECQLSVTRAVLDLLAKDAVDQGWGAMEAAVAPLREGGGGVSDDP